MLDANSNAPVHPPGVPRLRALHQLGFARSAVPTAQEEVEDPLELLRFGPGQPGGPPQPDGTQVPDLAVQAQGGEVQGVAAARDRGQRAQDPWALVQR